MASRDDFSANTKATLAKRVGYKCSNPDCRKLTIGPKEGDSSAMSDGIAAHITAAAPGGPRYCVEMTQEERKSLDNGIWLCSNCSILIDRDVHHYTVDLLKQWKVEAEKRAHDELSGATSLDANQIDTAIRINTNMAVDEVMHKIDESTQDLKETIKHIPNNNRTSTNDTIFSRKLDILKAIEKYELPEYRLDICPQKINHNNPKVSQAEMGVLFKNPSILTYFSSLISHIDEMDKQISEILQFYREYCESDGYGAWQNTVWDKILYYETLLGKPYSSDDTIKEFEEYCNKNTYSEYISELDEYHTINYYIVQKRIYDISSEFKNIKNRLISLISEEIT